MSHILRWKRWIRCTGVTVYSGIVRTGATPLRLNGSDMKYRPHSWMFMIVLVLVGIPVALTGGVAAQSTGYVDMAASDLSGSGTAAAPYVITNASELQAMEDNVTANYILGEDIDASGTANWNNGAGFDPIDDLGGTFDGAGHTIESLTIDRPGEGNVGLFIENGYRSQGGHVYNVTISNADVTGDFNVGILAGSNSGESKITNVDINGTATSNANVGGIVSINQGRILNSSSDVSVSGSGAAGGIAASSQGSVENVFVSGNVGGKNSVGGIIGSNKGTISQASSTAEINGAEFIGGIVGYNYNTTLLSFASGSVSGSETVGGLTGANSGNVTKTYATGSVSANKEVGGLIGQSFRSESIVAESFAVGVVTGQSEVGGAIGSSFDTTIKNVYWDTETVGQQISAGGTGLTTTEMTGDAAETNMAEFAFGSAWQTQADNYPILIALSSESDRSEDNDNRNDATEFVDVDPDDLSGTGTSDDPYIITNASELQAMEDNLSANYMLNNNINASSTAQFNNGSGFDPVGTAEFGTSDQEFKGTLDGNNQTITGLTIDRPDQGYVGLFGSFDSGTVANISLTGVAVTGDFETGGLVGETRSNSTIQNVTISGTVSGTYDVGGLVGAAEDNTTIQAVTSSADVIDDGGDSSVGGVVGGVEGETIIQNARASGNVTGDGATGGLVGRNSGTIQNVTATGSVTNISSSFSSQQGGLVGRNSGTIQNAVASTTVDGNDVVGGLVGFNGDYSDGEGIIQNSTATGSVTGERNVGGLVGKNNDRGIITNVKASGSVDGNRTTGGLVGRNSNGTIQNSIAVGSVSGDGDTGGVVGNNTDLSGISGTVAGSYWDRQATGQNTSAGNAVGLTTVEMIGAAAETNMSRLDFGSIWETRRDNYPRLTLQVSDKDTLTTVPPDLKGDLTSRQYAAVLADDSTLTASNLADAINGWADNGKVNGTNIGAFELSELINYWAGS